MIYKTLFIEDVLDRNDKSNSGAEPTLKNDSFCKG